MKKILKAAVAAIGLTALTTGAQADDWTPPGPIKLMIAFAAGGGADTQARMIAEELEAAKGWKANNLHLKWRFETLRLNRSKRLGLQITC